MTTKQPLSLERRVLQFIQKHSLLSSRQKIVVAVSGGPDSICLLNILFKLQEELSIRLHVAHLDHQLRGVESEADAKYVSGLASCLGIPFTLGRCNVKAYQARKHLSLEEAAREVRYDYMAKIAGSIGAERLAVGHTNDDHVETILMHIIRGAGIRGLRGLQPLSRWQSKYYSLNLIRPMLQVSRQETADYCRVHRLMPRVDTSNLSLSLLRNKIRHEFLPLLENYNPRVSEALLRTARIADEILAFLNGESTRLFRQIALKQGNTVVLGKKKLLELPSALQRHLLRMSIEELIGNLKDIEACHIEEIMAALTKPAGKRVSLPAGLVFSIEYDRYLLGSNPVVLSPFPNMKAEFKLNIPGETLSSDWRVEAEVMYREQMSEEDDELTAYFDLAKTGDTLLVRLRRVGDRFQPLGMSQSKKLAKFMIDARIPQAWRQRVPLVCSPQHILWVVGWRIDDRVKVSSATEQVLRLKFERR